MAPFSSRVTRVIPWAGQRGLPFQIRERLLQLYVLVFLDESKTKLEWLPVFGIVGDNVFLEKSAAERARISDVQMKTVRKIRRNL